MRPPGSGCWGQPVSTVPLARLEEIIDASGVAPRIETLLPIGVRQRQLQVRTLLAGMLLTLADHRPAHLTRVLDALTALPPKDQARLGVTEDWKAGPHQLTYRQTERTGSQAGEQFAAGKGWQDTGLVFTSHQGAPLDAANVRKMFKRICTETGIGDGWTPRELRTTFVSLLSHHGVAIEEIARLVGHASTRTTEIVYRRELRPVITTGAEVMDQLFTTT